jgi:hypothetical protein
MEDNRDRQFDPTHPPRRFVYRAPDRETNFAHPLRRATDAPHPLQAIPGQICPDPLLLKFRVYLKLN